jgi:hypothetical protein
MKTLLTLILILTISSNFSYCQEFKIPSNYKLDKDEDYPQYEKDVIAAINYVENTPLNKIPNKKEINAFLSAWITGTPSVTIELFLEMIPFRDNKDLLAAYMNGWTKFAIENPSLKSDTVKCNVAALESVIKVYKLNDMKKVKSIEEFIKLQNKDELEKWVRKNLKKS